MTGRQVRNLRVQMGYTQHEFGLQLGYFTSPQSCMSRLESTERPVSSRVRVIIQHLVEHGPIEELLPERSERGPLIPLGYAKTGIIRLARKRAKKRKPRPRLKRRRLARRRSPPQ